MLNYIWTGLIVLSLVFALVTDIGAIRRDSYRNGKALSLRVAFPAGYDPEAGLQPVQVRADSSALAAHYGVSMKAIADWPGQLVQGAAGRELRFAKGADLAEPLATIRSMTSERDNDLRGPVRLTAAPGDTLVAAEIVFAPVRFVKLVAITQAGIDFAKTAVTLALGLIGVMALWLGMLRIAEVSGLIQVIVRLFEPLLRPLFPEIPRGHPALGLIVLNLSANVLGLGNAATPMGIKAMEELQKLNPVKDTATNAMVMLLAINTASVQIVPPVLLVAIMGLGINQLWAPIVICTGLSLLVAILAAKLLGRVGGYRRSDPMLAPGDGAASGGTR